MSREHRHRVVLALSLMLLTPPASGRPGHPFVPKESRRLSQETIVPEKGVFLVASPDLLDPRFRRTVVLLLAHGEDGTLGLIINRATKVPLSDVLPNPKNPGNESHTLFFGGPVQLDGLLFLTRSAEPPERATHVMADVYFSGDRGLLEKLIGDNKDASELRTYLGRSGWAPGQLASEIAAGSWRLVRADAHTVFERDLDTIWRNLLEPPRPPPFIVRREPGYPVSSAEG